MLTTIRPELLIWNSETTAALAPFLWVLGGIVVAMLSSMVQSVFTKWTVLLCVLIACVGAFYTAFTQLSLAPVHLFNDMLVVDGFANFFNLIFLAVTAGTAAISVKYLDQEGLQYPEFYLLLLFALTGMMFLAAATDLITIFIALELMSLAVYVLVGFRRSDRRSNEASLKYFILGAVASAVYLYGSALLYGTTGSTQISVISKALLEQPLAMNLVFILGAWFVLAGFLFKVAVVPFHMWMPDVYEGAPVPVTGFMTTALKCSAFAVLMRLLVGLGYGKNTAPVFQNSIHHVFWICAILTMFVGNILALSQVQLKRMFAYSSIAHTGYLLVGLLTLSGGGHYEAVLAYLVGYSVMNFGAFAVLAILAGREDRKLTIADMAGLSERRPGLAFAMAVFLFSMAGMPPLAGFVTKYSLFYTALASGEVLLVVLAVLCSAISVYYYLRVLVFMYMKKPPQEFAGTQEGSIGVASLSVGLMAVLTLLLGVLPSGLFVMAKQAVTSLVQ